MGEIKLTYVLYVVHLTVHLFHRSLFSSTTMDFVPLYDKKRAGEELEKQVDLRNQGFHYIKSAVGFTEVLAVYSIGHVTDTNNSIRKRIGR